MSVEDKTGLIKINFFFSFVLVSMWTILSFVVKLIKL